MRDIFSLGLKHLKSADPQRPNRSPADVRACQTGNDGQPIDDAVFGNALEQIARSPIHIDEYSENNNDVAVYRKPGRLEQHV